MITLTTTSSHVIVSSIFSTDQLNFFFGAGAGFTSFWVGVSADTRFLRGGGFGGSELLGQLLPFVSNASFLRILSNSAFYGKV